MSLLSINELYYSTELPSLFKIQPSTTPIQLSISACSLDSTLFSLSNDTHSVQLEFIDGLSTHTIQPSPSSITLQHHTNNNNSPFQIALSNSTTPLHQYLSSLPLFADSTSNQAIIFSPPFQPAPDLSFPSFPNYTLPPPNLSLPDQPSSHPNLTLVISPTTTTTTLIRSSCALLATSSVGTIINQSLWIPDDNGWRLQWLVDDLSPSTNYTAFVVQDGAKVSGPIYFTTKSPSFSCPLVSSLPYCPAVAYAVPLPQPPSSSPAYDASSIPTAISAPLLDYISNFTTTLLTFACGRDLYSPLQSCADCQRAYRTWLCAVSFTRCSEAPPDPPPSSDPQSPLAIAVAQPALVPQPPNATSRNPYMDPFPESYTALLPCIETCTAVDRACPHFLGFRCPLVQFNANDSYGVGYIDEGERGEQGGGATGVAQDRWGNVWCNGLGF